MNLKSIPLGTTWVIGKRAVSGLEVIPDTMGDLISQHALPEADYNPALEYHYKNVDGFLQSVREYIAPARWNKFARAARKLWADANYSDVPAALFSTEEEAIQWPKELLKRSHICDNNGSGYWLRAPPVR